LRKLSRENQGRRSIGGGRAGVVLLDLARSISTSSRILLVQRQKGVVGNDLSFDRRSGAAHERKQGLEHSTLREYEQRSRHARFVNDVQDCF
jgi:hypothetical protein